jgi:phosphatidylglycerol:prolipoprotein diacylglycerol transferase
MPDWLLLAIAYPRIDPVAFELGPFQVRWYALAYVAALLFAWWYARRLVAGQPQGRKTCTTKDIDDLLFWGTLGVVLGGRLGYVLFYKPGYFLLPENWIEIPKLWTGGMSFHGGLLGVIVAVWLYCRWKKLNLLAVGDLACAGAPIGLFLGRMTNFINGELWGRVSDVPWAMVFPTGGPLPRHPSQLYQGFLEGLCVFALIWIVRRRTGSLDRPGEICGLFGLGYGLARIVGEFFREPDAHLGYLAFGTITMGMILSLPLLLVGWYLIARARRRAAATAT